MHSGAHYIPGKCTKGAKAGTASSVGAVYQPTRGHAILPPNRRFWVATVRFPGLPFARTASPSPKNFTSHRHIFTSRAPRTSVGLAKNWQQIPLCISNLFTRRKVLPRRVERVVSRCDSYARSRDGGSMVRTETPSPFRGSSSKPAISSYLVLHQKSWTLATSKIGSGTELVIHATSAYESLSNMAVRTMRNSGRNLGVVPQAGCDRATSMRLAFREDFLFETITALTRGLVMYSVVMPIADFPGYPESPGKVGGAWGKGAGLEAKCRCHVHLRPSLSDGTLQRRNVHGTQSRPSFFFIECRQASDVVP